MTCNRIYTLNFLLGCAVTVDVGITLPPEPLVYGKDYTLKCEAHTQESKPALTHPLLRHYLIVEWFDIDNVPVSSQRSLTVGGLTSNFSRALHFQPVRRGHDRLYVCVATLNLPDAKVNATAQYRIVLGEYNILLKSIYMCFIPVAYYSEFVFS